MKTPPTQEVTGLLLAWSDGDRSALDKLTPLVEGELRRLAHRYMARERGGHTLQTTALVNEAYLHLVNQEEVRWQKRAQFFGLAAQVMRHILIDHARTRTRAKRGGRAEALALEEAAAVMPERAEELLALDEALRWLEKKHPRQGRVVVLRYFGGLSVKETAEVL
jgi:RNA polymerase sigma factor (TIGR02999 family)